jgi:hypothetical protein
MSSRCVSPFQDMIWPRKVTAITAITTVRDNLIRWRLVGLNFLSLDERQLPNLHAGRREQTQE